jgi:lipopolysaccharide transport system permease protein
MRAMPEVEFDADSRVARVRLTGLNGASTAGYQIFDPDTGTFIFEGEWRPVHSGAADLTVALPPERGRYHVYASPVDESRGWDYQLGRTFLLIDAEVEGGRARLLGTQLTTLSALRRRNLLSNIGRVFTLPVASLARNTGLLRSMVRRDLMARYRGSFADVLWTVLHPVLLMATYFFVFGVVLQSRFGPDQSRTGFALYFLAGMLPWLPFAEAAGRAPQVIVEHRNFVRKLVFPVEILPVTQVLSALVTEAFALLAFVIGLFIIRGDLPLLAPALVLLLVPQVLFTLGIAWFLAALGVFVRDLGQVMGFLLTLWFFLTPICYPEASLPPEALPILTKNPVYVLVEGYRSILLADELPPAHSLWKLWVVSIAAFLFGYAWFHKLRRSFADVI